MRKIQRINHLIMVGFLVFGLGTGCSTQTRTVTTETREYPSNGSVENRTGTNEHGNARRIRRRVEQYRRCGRGSSFATLPRRWRVAKGHFLIPSRLKD